MGQAQRGWGEQVWRRCGIASPGEDICRNRGRDGGVTNIRNPDRPHWRRWLAPEYRCLVPLTAFSEPGKDHKPVWFKPADDGPIMLAGIEARAWRSIRKVRDGETTDDLFGFLTCPPNAEVGAVHPKAMPVILRGPDEWAFSMNQPWDAARTLQRPLPDGALTTSQ